MSKATAEAPEAPAPTEAEIKEITGWSGSAKQPQRDLLHALMAEKQWPPIWRQEFLREIGRHGLTIRLASRGISFLIGQPRRRGAPSPPARPAQLSYVDSLLQERDIDIVDDGDYAIELRSKIALSKLSMAEASEAIDIMLDLPYRSELEITFPAGNYCLGTKQDPRRYQVTIWKGRVQLTLVEANDQRTRIKVAEAKPILAEIARDPIAAAKLYAAVTDRCFRCNRLLTVQSSVAAGMGPDCAKHLGL